MVLTRQRCPRISISMRHFIAEIGVEESLTRSCWCGGYRCPERQDKSLESAGWDTVFPWVSCVEDGLVGQCRLYLERHREFFATQG